LVRKGGEKDHLLQLPEAGIYCCGMPGNQKQAIYLKEVLQEEGSQTNMGFRE